MSAPQPVQGDLTRVAHLDPDGLGQTRERAEILTHLGAAPIEGAGDWPTSLVHDPRDRLPHAARAIDDDTLRRRRKHVCVILGAAANEGHTLGRDPPALQTKLTAA